jgi:uncharacterized Tic20 family protein
MAENDPNTGNANIPPPVTPSGGYPAPYAGPPADKDSITMALLCHLLGIFTAFLGPLIIWLLKKDSSPFVDDQGKEALNFQITRILASLACFIGLCIAPILIAIVQVTCLVFAIIATIQSGKGVPYRYPLCLRLVK